MNIIETFNDNNYDFTMFHNRIICYHHYGKYRKSTLKIMCDINKIDDETIKKAVIAIKKELKEAKKYSIHLHGCTEYLNSIKINN